MEAESEQSSQHMRGQSITSAPAGIPEQLEARTDFESLELPSQQKNKEFEHETGIRDRCRGV